MALGFLIGIGTGEIIWIVLAVVVLFGATRVPQFMRGLGQGIKEFKSAVKDDTPEPAKPKAAGSTVEDEKKADPPTE